MLGRAQHTYLIILPIHCLSNKKFLTDYWSNLCNSSKLIYVIQRNKQIWHLHSNIFKHIKIIAIFKSRDGRFRQNSNLLAAIQFNAMRF